MRGTPLISERGGAALLRVSLRPAGGRDGIGGIRAGALAVVVSAPPVDGRANEALRKLLARAAGIPPRRVSIVKGLTARTKTVRFEGLSRAQVADRLGLAEGEQAQER